MKNPQQPPTSAAERSARLIELLTALNAQAQSEMDSFQYGGLSFALDPKTQIAVAIAFGPQPFDDLVTFVETVHQVRSGKTTMRPLPNA